MTKRQKSLGVTEYGYKRGCKKGEFLADSEEILEWINNNHARTFLLHRYTRT